MDGQALRASCAWGMMVDRLRMAPLFGRFSLSLDSKCWPPARLLELFFECQDAL